MRFIPDALQDLISPQPPADAAHIALGGFAGTRGPRAITQRGAWRLAGLLFLVGSLFTIPAVLLIATPVEGWVYAVIAAAMASGVLCLRVRWDRLDDRWLALVPVVAVVEIGLAVAATDYTLSYLYFFVTVYVALVYPSAREMAPYLILIAVALLFGFVHGGDSPRNMLLWAMVVGLPVVFTAMVVGRVTANLESSRETYRTLLGVDGLTGVGNYRALVERLSHETARHKRKGRDFALLSLDLDGFKSVNDTQGHLIGDLVLAIVASMIDLELRVEDAVYRQGGDEFTVVAPETGRDHAWLLAARIERKVSELTAGPVEISASVGVAIYPEDGREPGALLDAADASLRSQRHPPAGSLLSRL